MSASSNTHDDFLLAQALQANEQQNDNPSHQRDMLRSSVELLHENTANDEAISHLLAHQDQLTNSDNHVGTDLDEKINKSVKTKPKRKWYKDFFTFPTLDDFAMVPMTDQHGRPLSREEYEAELRARREHEKAKKRLRKRLARWDLAEYAIASDGNCQFKSISDQLYRSTKLHRVIRQIAVQEIISHRSHYQSWITVSFDRYVTIMSAHGTWGDNITLQSISNAMNIEINIVTGAKDDADARLQITPNRAHPGQKDDTFDDRLPTQHKTPRSIWISYMGNHYTSIYPQDEIRRRQKEDHKCIIQ